VQFNLNLGLLDDIDAEILKNKGKYSAKNLGKEKIYSSMPNKRGDTYIFLPTPGQLFGTEE
jgi:hypothetical protein